jgi:hypothetical protein
MTGPALKPKMRYRARFTPEAWIGDYAVEVEAQGPAEWDCTRLATEPRSQDYLRKLMERRPGERLTDPDGVLDNDDWFAADPDAPEWIRNWSGPSTVRIWADPVVTVYYQVETTRAADLPYSTVAELAADGDVTVPPLAELLARSCPISLEDPAWAGPSLSEALHDIGYEVDGGGTMVTEFAIQYEEPGR